MDPYFVRLMALPYGSLGPLARCTLGSFTLLRICRCAALTIIANAVTEMICLLVTTIEIAVRFGYFL